MSSHKLLIIGSGPAGLTAAIYGARALLSPLVVEGGEPGGQLTTTTEVENFPGFPDSILGPVLVQNMRKQAERLGVQFHSGVVVGVDFSVSPKVIRFADKSELTAEAVVIATGASAKWLGLPSEQRLRGRGVSACATCDGFFFKGKEVAVNGGGDTALQDALYLTRFCPKVHLIHRRDAFRASKANQELIKKNPAIVLHLNAEVAEVLGEQMVNGVRLRDVKTQATSDLAVGGLFVAIGHQPNTQFLAGSGLEIVKDYIVAKDHVFTNIPGVFVAGDCEDHVYRQAVTAAGFGCMATLAAEKWLAEKSC